MVPGPSCVSRFAADVFILLKPTPPQRPGAGAKIGLNVGNVGIDVREVRGRCFCHGPPKMLKMHDKDLQVLLN